MGLVWEAKPGFPIDKVGVFGKEEQTNPGSPAGFSGPDCVGKQKSAESTSRAWRRARKKAGWWVGGRKRFRRQAAETRGLFIRRDSTCFPSSRGGCPVTIGRPKERTHGPGAISSIRGPIHRVGWLVKKYRRSMDIRGLSFSRHGAVG